jgi:hypothetical protein
LIKGIEWSSFRDYFGKVKIQENPKKVKVWCQIWLLIPVDYDFQDEFAGFDPQNVLDKTFCP